MRLLLLSRYGRRSATSRQRQFQFLPALAAAGIEVETDSLLDDAYVDRLYAGGRARLAPLLAAYARRLARLREAARFDVVWVEKEILPWLPAAAERRVAGGRAALVVDFDDAWFHRYDAHPRAVVRRLLGAKIDRVMATADLVTAGSPYIAERAVRAGARRVEVVPTVVDTARLVPRLPDPGRPLTIGWIGTPANARYLAPIRDALAAVLARAGGRLLLVGAPADTLATTLGGLPGEVRPWREEREVADLAEMDVGVMPLPDTPFERGKCGYKLIQYMAAARPVVASPVGVNARLVADDAGLLATTPAEWEAALDRLARDGALRARMGTAGRKRVEIAYSLEATAPRMVALLREAAAAKARAR